MYACLPQWRVCTKKLKLCREYSLSITQSQKPGANTQDPDLARKNQLENIFFIINMWVSLRGCWDGRIWSSGQTLTRCPECSDLDLSRKCHLEIISDVKFIGGLWLGFRMAEFGRPDRHSNDAPNLISKLSTLHRKDYVSARGRLRMSETRQRH